MIVMNRLNTENVFEDLDGLAAVEVTDDQQLVQRQNKPAQTRNGRPYSPLRP